ncbi:MAG: hypothetical protein IKB66_05560 [Clostridia bacterium]|nr:hypothetical protein [Clostridia bacterium]
MKNKLNKGIVLAVLCACTFLILTGFAMPQNVYASEGEILTNTDKAQEFITYVKEELAPVISGLLTAITAILAMLVPYLKTIGKLKQTQGAYSVMYNENEKLMKITESKDVEQMEKSVAERVIANIEERFAKYDNLLSKILKEGEISNAQINSLIEGAKIAWKEAEGAGVALCKAPSATVLEKQMLAVDFLKTYVAKELGIKREELDKKIDEELSLT